MSLRRFFTGRLSRIDAVTEFAPFPFVSSEALPQELKDFLRELHKKNGNGDVVSVPTTNFGDVIMILTEEDPFVIYLVNGPKQLDPPTLLMSASEAMLKKYNGVVSKSPIDISLAKEFYLGKWATCEDNFVAEQFEE